MQGAKRFPAGRKINSGALQAESSRLWGCVAKTSGPRLVYFAFVWDSVSPSSHLCVFLCRSHLGNILSWDLGNCPRRSWSCSPATGIRWPLLFWIWEFFVFLSLWRWVGFHSENLYPYIYILSSFPLISATAGSTRPWSWKAKAISPGLQTSMYEPPFSCCLRWATLWVLGSWDFILVVTELGKLVGTFDEIFHPCGGLERGIGILVIQLIMTSYPQLIPWEY